jgi:plastocyanin
MTGKKLLGKGSLWLLVGLLLIMFGASGALAADGATIESFYAAPAVVGSGETTVLYWKATNASSIDIVGIERESEEALPLEGSLEVWPLITTSYVLIVHGTDGKDISKSVTVNVDLKGDVHIDYFKASATEIASGNTVTLSWMASNAENVRLIGISAKDDECIRPIIGNVEVWPTETTTYLLEATGKSGEITSAAVTVNVYTAPVVEPKILTFKASKTEISKGDLVILSWTTENVVKCSISTGSSTITNRPANGAIGVTPNKTKTFTLTAYDANGKSVQESLTITVK